MRTAYSILISMVIIILIGVGCSGSNPGNPLAPVTGGDAFKSTQTDTFHTNWGIWQFTCNPVEQTVDVVRLRDGAMHVNVLTFLDQPPLVNLTLESLHFDGDLLDADIGLRHPFLGLVEFTGFDVKGIFITKGNMSGFADGNLILAGPGDTRLLNPDGYTRWWNPSEFPNNGTMFGYMDGALGTPDSVADFSSTLNGYKYFCDDLTDPDSPMSDIDPGGRGMFSTGQKRIRHFAIRLDGGLVFNYAVDASWQFPTGSPPWNAPGSFGPNTNQPEAYRIEITETDNTLFYDEEKLTGGGDLNLSVDVYDWYNADLHTISAEWPGFADQTASSGASGGGYGFSTYNIDLLACTPSAIGEQQLFITVASENLGYGGIIPGEPVSVYFFYTTEVAPASIQKDPPDISTGWGTQTGPFNSGLINANTQFNMASDSNGKVWEWHQYCSNSTSRISAPFNGNWGTMYEYGGWNGGFGYSHSDYVDVSMTPTFDGGIIVGLSPKDNMGVTDWYHPLSIAWWDGSIWHEDINNGWLIYDVIDPAMIARRTNGYRDSTDRFHAFCQINGQLIDYYADNWLDPWSNTIVAPMPDGQMDYACQTRTNYVAETSDGYIYLCWVNNGIKVGKCKAGTTSWEIIDVTSDPNYDSPTIYIDNQDRIFIAARYYMSVDEDQIRLFKSTNGSTFAAPLTIFQETNARVDPCYIALKGDVEDQLFITFPYRVPAHASYIAIIAGNAGGETWTDKYILTDEMRKYPAMAVRPNGSIEVCYGYCTYPYYGILEGAEDKTYSERNELWGRSNPGFIG